MGLNYTTKVKFWVHFGDIMTQRGVYDRMRVSSLPSSHNAVVEGVFLRVVCPVGGGHAAVRVQQDPETPDDEEGQEDEEQQHEDEGRLLLQRQVGGYVVSPRRPWQSAAEQALCHPRHVHARPSGLQRSCLGGSAPARKRFKCTPVVPREAPGTVSLQRLLSMAAAGKCSLCAG